jgi:predicted DNA-binding transcriptional regulator AlpA
MDTVRPCGPVEVATLHAIKRSTAYRWSDRDRLPPPTWLVSSHRVWTLDAITHWSKQIGKYQDAIDRWVGHLDGKGLYVGELTFEVLYDLLALGQPATRTEEIGVPIRDG